MIDSEKKKKKLKWNIGVREVLIPTRDEYKDAGLADSIWWNEVDFGCFRDSAAEEVNNAMVFLRVDLKEAIRTLYQPEMDWKCRFNDDARASGKSASHDYDSQSQGFRDDSLKKQKTKYDCYSQHLEPAVLHGPSMKKPVKNAAHPMTLKSLDYFSVISDQSSFVSKTYSQEPALVRSVTPAPYSVSTNMPNSFSPHGSALNSPAHVNVDHYSNNLKRNYTRQTQQHKEQLSNQFMMQDNDFQNQSLLEMCV
jgi:hypothetical protein